MANNGKRKVPVLTTMTEVVDFACTVGLSGTVAASGVPVALSCSIVDSTIGGQTAQPLNGQTTATPMTQRWTGGMIQVSGTSPGLVTVQIHPDASYGRLISWGADLVSTKTALTNFGGQNQQAKAHYVLEKAAYQYPYGSQWPSGSSVPLNVNSTANGGSVFKLQVTQLQHLTGAVGGTAFVSGAYADPVDASCTSGSAVAHISIWAKFRTRARDNS